ncbi:THAP domain-containing protein 5-like isoform X2 [Pomacea canaliculata]|uniref:THAP domain-containing protein 5-like isoform X2 n=1 Tax=Pomacea canaliculata TaxID=400727 RepID=UPI000D73ABC1|nr:THAP domain-containing protein 5-like isoform X2 [Pomacea canaliculata]
MPKECAAPDCQEKGGKDSKYSFHKFPKDRALRKEWAIRIKRFDPKTKKLWEPKDSDTLCSKHFVYDCFTSRTRMSRQLGLPFAARLLPDAVPTIFQHNEIARKRKKDLSDRRSVSVARLRHKQNSSESTSKCMEANTWLSKEYTPNKQPCPVKTKRSAKRASGTDTGSTKIFLKTIKMEDNPDIDDIEITAAGSEKSSTMNKLTPFIKKELEDLNSSWSAVRADNDGFENKTEIFMAGSEESSSVNKLTSFMKKEPEDFNSPWGMVQADNDGLTTFIKKEPEDFNSSLSMVLTDNDGFENKMETKVYPTGIYCNLHFAHRLENRL